MNFVYEEVKEEDYKIFKSFDLINPYTNKQPSIGYWTVDKTLDIYLIKVGTGSGILELQPEYFALIWNGQKILFEGYYTILEQEKYWDITVIQVPDEIKENKIEIYEVVKEALMVHGVYGKGVVIINSFPEIELEKPMELKKGWTTFKIVFTLIGLFLVFFGGIGTMASICKGNIVVTERYYHQHSLNEKTGIAVDSDGNIYIGEGETGCIQVYDSIGNFQYGFSFPEGNWFSFAIEQGKVHVLTYSRDRYFVFDKGKLVYYEEGIDSARSQELEKQYNIKSRNSYKTKDKTYKNSSFNTVKITDEVTGQVEKIHLNAPIWPFSGGIFLVIGAAGTGLIFILHRKFFLSISK